MIQLFCEYLSKERTCSDLHQMAKDMWILEQIIWLYKHDTHM